MKKFLALSLAALIPLQAAGQAQTVAEFTKPSGHSEWHADSKKETYSWKDKDAEYRVDLYFDRDLVDISDILVRHKMPHYDVEIRRANGDSISGSYTSFMYMHSSFDRNRNDIPDPAIGYAACKKGVTEFIFTSDIVQPTLRKECDFENKAAFGMIEDAVKHATDLRK